MNRSLAAAAAVCAVGAGLLACAGCSAGPASSRGAAESASASVSAPVPLPARSLPSPGCSAAIAGRAAPARTAAGVRIAVRTATARVPAEPFGVVWAPGGRWAFVSVATGVEVLRAGRALALVPVRRIGLPGVPQGEAITPNGRYLLVADGAGAIVISVARAEQGTPGAVLGTLSAVPGVAGGPAPTPRMSQAMALLKSAIGVAVSPDGRYAFATLEYADRAVVFNLARALATGFGQADYVGAIPLGESATGLAVAPSGRWLYATSEVGGPGSPLPAPSAAGPPTAAPSAGGLTGAEAAACPETYQGETPGTLAVISLGQAETDPAHAVAGTAEAGFQPVRVITSADGSQIWVTARASDDLLCFSAARLASDPARALVAVVRVGEAPVGLAAADDGALIVVADSDRFGTLGATADLDLVSVPAALAGRAAVAGQAPTGAFPRELAGPAVPDGPLLVTDFGSNQLEAVTVTTPPAR